MQFEDFEINKVNVATRFGWWFPKGPLLNMVHVARIQSSENYEKKQSMHRSTYWKIKTRPTHPNPP